MITEMHRSVVLSITVRGNTFRAGGMQDATGYSVFTVDSWTGWQFKRVFQWEGQGMNEPIEACDEPWTIAGKLSAIIDGVIKNMETIVGPMDEHERSYVRTVLGYEAETVLIRRLRRANHIGAGALQCKVCGATEGPFTMTGECEDGHKPVDQCSTSNPENMCDDCRKGWESLTPEQQEAAKQMGAGE